MNLTVKSGPSTADHWPQPLQGAILDGLAFTNTLFWGPELEFCSALHRGDGLDFLREPLLIRALGASGDMADKIWADARLYESPTTLFQNLEAEYITQFISNREGIPAPLYHSCYLEPEGSGSQPLLMGEPAVEMRKRLADVGLALAGDSNELPDHLCIEIEYLYFLLSEGWAKGNEERLAEGRHFAGEWMLPWVRRFQDRLVAVDENGFYTLVAGMLADMLDVLSGERNK